MKSFLQLAVGFFVLCLIVFAAAYFVTPQMDQARSLNESSERSNR